VMARDDIDACVIIFQTGSRQRSDNRFRIA
jgi:hypothetical protein